MRDEGAEGGAGAEAARRAERTARLRQGTLRVRAAPGATVRVRQLRHGFEFGSPFSSRTFDDERETELVRRWFNAGVIPVKWQELEAAPGRRTWAEAEAVLDACDRLGFARRAHCLFYAHRLHVPPWVRALPAGDALAAMERHAREAARRLRGRVAEYDLCNELLDGSWYEERFGPDILRRMADWVLEEDPDAVLCVNEHDILTGGDIDRYVALIDRLLSDGVPLGGIGCQGHLDPPFRLGHVEPALDRLAAFGLPVKITEADSGIRLKQERYRGVPWIDGAERFRDPARFRRILAALPADFEERKARAVEGLFRRAFAHPAVRALYVWGYREGRHWRTRGELVRRDLSLLPAGAALDGLVRGAWWTEATAVAGPDGFCAVRAFHGRHAVESRGVVREAELTPARRTVIVEVAAPGADARPGRAPRPGEGAA